MKKTIFTFFAVVLASAGAFAQLEQGTMIVGGDFGLEFSTRKTKLDNQTNTNGKNTYFALEPKFGYFVIDNLAVGGEFSIAMESWKPEGTDGKSTGTSFSFGPFVRYYFPPKVFLEGKYAFGASKYKDDFFGDVDESKYALGGWSLGAGYAAFLNDNVAVEPMIGYQAIGSKNKTTGEAEARTIDSGLFFRVGLQVYLR